MALSNLFLDQRLGPAAATSAVRSPMPFFHTCEYVHFLKILDAAALSPVHCDVYAEDLLYLFYGRPAYRKVNREASNMSAFMPVGFILDNAAVSTMKRIAPFDTGGFSEYKGFIHPNSPREEYYLSPNKNAIEQFLNFFYKGNGDYFDGIQKGDHELDYDRAHYQVESVLNLMRDKSTGNGDDRKATIEVQVDYKIPINTGLLQAVILPSHIAQSLSIKSVLDSWGVDILSYRSQAIASREYYSEFLSIARQFLTSKSILV